MTKAEKEWKALPFRKEFAGDFATPEQRVGAFDIENPWESCITICRQWAWKPKDKMKSFDEGIQTLIKTVGGGGNLLFNVGPMPDGRIEPRQVDRLKEMGTWLKKYGESIYGTTGGPYKPTEKLASTRKGDKIYLHLFNSETNTVTIPNPGEAKVKNCQVLKGDELNFKQVNDGLTITIPETSKNGTVLTIEIQLNTNAANIEAIEIN